MLSTIDVLLVEDEPAMGAWLRQDLEDHGYQVVLAENGSRALSIIKGRNHGFTGLVTDVRLGPGPNGWQVARRARELNGRIPIVYITGEAGSQWHSRGVPNSVLIRKPFVGAQIAAAISSLLNKGAALK